MTGVLICLRFRAILLFWNALSVAVCFEQRALVKSGSARGGCVGGGGVGGGVTPSPIRIFSQ